jgi:hypothetical protein
LELLHPVLKAENKIIGKTNDINHQEPVRTSAPMGIDQNPVDFHRCVPFRRIFHLFGRWRIEYRRRSHPPGLYSDGWFRKLYHTIGKARVWGSVIFAQRSSLAILLRRLKKDGQLVEA